MIVPKVSVIIPLYYAEEYIDVLLAQLREQPLQEVEVICVIDGSPDGTLDIVKRHAGEDGRIRWVDQENAGAGAARNAGLERAGGEYLVFMDADDSYDPQLLTKMYETAKEHDADLVVCQFEQIDLRSGKAWDGEGFNDEAVPTGRAFSALELEKPFIDISVVPNHKLFRKAVVDGEALRFSTTRVANDIFFSLAMIAASERIVAIPDILVTRRKFASEHSISSHRADHTEDSFTGFLELRIWLKRHNLFDSYKDTYVEAWANALHYNAGYGRNSAFIRLAAKELACEDPWRDMGDRELRKAARLDPSMIAVKRLAFARQANKAARKIEVEALRNEERAVKEIIRLLNDEYGKSLPTRSGVLLGIYAHLQRLGLYHSLHKLAERTRRGR